jgi:Transglutaminase-like superfamily
VTLLVTHDTRALSPLSKMALALEIVVTYAGVRRRMRVDQLPDVVTWLRALSTPAGPLRDGSIHGRRLGEAIVRTLNPLPVDSRCLMRSLVLLGLLARRGVAADLVVAVKEPNIAATLDAHAWVEHAGQPLLWPGDAGYERLVTL